MDLICVSLRQRNSVSWEKRSGSLADYPVDDDRSDDDSLYGCALDVIPRFVVPFFFFAAGDPVPVILSVPAFPVRLSLCQSTLSPLGLTYRSSPLLPPGSCCGSGFQSGPSFVGSSGNGFFGSHEGGLSGAGG